MMLLMVFCELFVDAERTRLRVELEAVRAARRDLERTSADAASQIEIDVQARQVHRLREGVG